MKFIKYALAASALLVATQTAPVFATDDLGDLALEQHDDTFTTTDDLDWLPPVDNDKRDARCDDPTDPSVSKIDTVELSDEAIAKALHALANNLAFDIPQNEDEVERYANVKDAKGKGHDKQDDYTHRDDADDEIIDLDDNTTIIQPFAINGYDNTKDHDEDKNDDITYTTDDNEEDTGNYKREIFYEAFFYESEEGEEGEEKKYSVYAYYLDDQGNKVILGLVPVEYADKEEIVDKDDQDKKDE